MKIILVSKCSLDIEQYVEFKMSVLISPSKSLISWRLVTIALELNCDDCNTQSTEPELNQILMHWNRNLNQTDLWPF